MPDSVSALNPQHPHVVDLFCFAAGFLDAMEQAFGAEKIFLRRSLGQRKKESPIAAAEIDMEWRTTPEDFRQIERREVRLRDQSDHGERIAPAAG